MKALLLVVLAGWAAAAEYGRRAANPGFLRAVQSVLSRMPASSLPANAGPLGILAEAQADSAADLKVVALLEDHLPDFEAKAAELSPSEAAVLLAEAAAKAAPQAEAVIESRLRSYGRRAPGDGVVREAMLLGAFSAKAAAAAAQLKAMSAAEKPAAALAAAAVEAGPAQVVPLDKVRREREVAAMRAAGLFVTPAEPARRVSGKITKVPAGTKVELRPNNGLYFSSEMQMPLDGKLHMYVKGRVLVDGKVVIDDGAPALATIVSIRHREAFKRGGEIRFKLEKVRGADNGWIPLYDGVMIQEPPRYKIALAVGAIMATLGIGTAAANGPAFLGLAGGVVLVMLIVAVVIAAVIAIVGVNTKLRAATGSVSEDSDVYGARPPAA